MFGARGGGHSHPTVLRVQPQVAPQVAPRAPPALKLAPRTARPAWPSAAAAAAWQPPWRPLPRHCRCTGTRAGRVQARWPTEPSTRTSKARHVQGHRRRESRSWPLEPGPGRHAAGPMADGLCPSQVPCAPSLGLRVAAPMHACTHACTHAACRGRRQAPVSLCAVSQQVRPNIWCAAARQQRGEHGLARRGVWQRHHDPLLKAPQQGLQVGAQEGACATGARCGGRQGWTRSADADATAAACEAKADILSRHYVAFMAATHGGAPGCPPCQAPTACWWPPAQTPAPSPLPSRPSG